MEKEIQAIQDKVSLVAEFPQIRSSDSEVCSQKLAEVTPYLHGQADNITRFNTDFILDCAVNRAAIGYDLTVDPESEIIALIKSSEHVPDLSHSGYSPVTDKYVLYLTVPVFAEDGSYYGLIGGVTYLDNFSDKYLTNIEVNEGGYFTLVDDDGTILYHPDVAYIGHKYDSPEAESLDTSAILGLSEEGGSYRHLSMGEDLISVSAQTEVFPDRTWIVILTVPVASAIAGINTSQGLGGLNVFLSLSGLIILVLIIFYALIMAYIISGLFRPLSDISAAAEKIGEGNLKVEISDDLLRAKDEFGQLAKVIKGMTSKLNESYSLLEERVEERTKDLKQSTEELNKINSFMMGRELKMSELKKENAKLKEELDIKDSDKK